VAKLRADSGLIAVCAFISPYRAEREMVRRLVPEGEFIEVFVDTPIDECARRDARNMARAPAA
jgi:bifunctional enzyme CysN/CysC